MTSHTVLYLFGFCLLFLSSVECSGALKTYNINSGEITLSGLSSGACMVSQFHVAHSSQIKGAAVLAGCAYYCANSNVLTAEACMKGVANVKELVSATSYAALTLSIDNPSHLAKSKVWLYSGTQDTIVAQNAVKAVDSYYQNYVSSSQISTTFNIPSVHGWITNGIGAECNDFGTPFINNCTFDSSGALLQYFYGNLNKPVTPKAANLLSFDQSNYTPGFTPSSISMDQNGFVYVPTSCQNGSLCRLHVCWHGCEQGYQYVGMQFINENQLNNWAESNDIIVLYPQAVNTAVLNPDGCWDWWGYTGLDYATKSGSQIKAVNSMISALLG